MKRIGLTGGIGSGKTTVARIFHSLGIPIYYADERGRHLLQQDVDLKDAIRKEFGDEVMVDQAIDRKALGSIVFKNPNRLAALNALVHPAVGRDYRAWCEATEGEAPYTIKEAAILFETGGHREMDATILVTAPEELRIERVMSRDGVTREEVLARMKNQWPEKDKVELADHIITNDGEHSLVLQVMDLHGVLKV